MKNKLLFVFLILLLSNRGIAQNYQWANSFSGSGVDASVKGISIAVDSSGNVYNMGSFKGSIDFDPGEGTSILTSGVSEDFYILKTDASGNFIWVKSIAGNSFIIANSMAVENSGVVFLTGYFMGTIMYEKDSTNVLLNTKDEIELFILKIYSNGNFAWFIKLDDTAAVYANSISIDLFGNIITTGGFIGSTDFDPGAGTFIMTPTGREDIFISKLDSNGNFIWAKSIGSKHDEHGKIIQTDIYGNIYISGTFRDTIDFNPGLGVNYLMATDYDSYIVKLDAAGNFVWSKSFDVPTIFSLNIDKLGNVLTTGLFKGTIDFDPGSGIFNLIAISSNVFITKLDSSGNFVWAKSIGGNIYTDAGIDVIADDSGNVFTTGYFIDNYYGPIDFDPGVGTFFLNGSVNEDIFIVKLNPSGNFIWAKVIAGNKTDMPASIAHDRSGNIYITGYFSGAVDFDPGTGTKTLTSGLNTNAFTLKLGSCLLTINSQPKNAHIILGEDARFYVNTSNTSATYRWQLNTGTGFNDIAALAPYSGVNNDTLTISQIGFYENYKYRCIMSDGNCSVTSNTATLNIDCDFSISRQPEDQWVYEDSAAHFSLAINKPNLTFQWQYNSGSGFINLIDSGNVSGVYKDSLSIGNVSFSQNNTSFRCIVKRTGCSVISRTETLFVKCNYELKKQPISQKIGVNNDVRFIVEGPDTTATYLWQENRGMGFKNIVDTLPYLGSDTDTLLLVQVKQTQNNYTYRCLVNYFGCEQSSDTALLNVQCTFNIITQPNDQYIRKDSFAIFTVLASNQNVYYQWQASMTSEKEYFNITDTNQVKLNKLKIANFPNSNYYSYRCLVSDSFCIIPSNEVKIYLCVNSFSTQPRSQYVTLGSSPEFSVTSPEFIKAFQWQKQNDSGFFDLVNSAYYSGVSEAVLTVHHVSAAQNLSVFRCAYLAGGCTIYSNPAMLSIDLGQTGIDNFEIKDGILIYPNPADDFITIEAYKSTQNLQYTVSNLSGKILLQGILAKAINTIDISFLIPGIYFVDVNGSKHKIIKSGK